MREARTLVEYECVVVSRGLGLLSLKDLLVSIYLGRSYENWCVLIG